MKKVFRNSSEVCHIYVNGVQKEGRCSNIFFYNDLIYSYGYHFCMAKKIDYNTILITDRKYSVTTSKHLSELRSAASHLDKVYCNKPEGSIWEQLPFIASDLKDNFSTLANNRKKEETKLSAKNSIQFIIENTNKLLAIFKTDITKLEKEFKKQSKMVSFLDDIKTIEFFDLWNVAQTMDLTLLNDLNAKRDKKVKSIQTKREKEAIKENNLKIDRWLNGENVYLNSSLTPVLLRLTNDGEQVETSLRAYVSLKAAKVLFEMIKAGKDIKGFDIDGYTVISLNGVLTIGCHKIERTEINRFSNLMNWGQIEQH